MKRVLPSQHEYVEVELNPPHLSGEGPGNYIIIAYVMMIIWGFIAGVGLGWLLWG